MATANDSVTVTPGSGATVATHLAGGKEHQVVIMANHNGHFLDDIPTYTCWSGNVAVSAANTVLMHIFNAAGSTNIVKIRKVFIQPSQTATTLTAQTWRVAKTSALGTTGATALTLQKTDTTDPNVPAAVTAQRGYTAGGTQTFTWFELPVDVEETRSGVALLPFYNILPTDGDRVSDIILQPGEGVAVQNVTGGAYTYSVLMVVTIE